MNVAGRGEVVEKGPVACYVAAVPHLHEEVQTGHVDAAEEAVYLPVRGFVEIAVIPHSAHC